MKTKTLKSTSSISLIYFIGLFSFLLTGCSKPVIEGKVVDYYNHPISEVNVSVQGTQFNSITDAAGKYSIGYVPGKVQLKYVKTGYAGASKIFDIANESTFPAEQTQLMKLPSSEGVWFLGDNDYMIVSTGKLIMNETVFDSYTPWIKGLEINVSANPTVLPSRSSYKFLISSAEKILLVKLLNRDLAYKRSSDGFYEKVNILRENSNEEISPSISVRTVSLGMGEYAYIRFLDTPEKPFNSSRPFRGSFYLQAYFFEIK
ncbi:MAG: carboxypeptidase-like regulatory domain-containing protein [Ignavibacteriaceae bacterium]|nr:carboxypeptidase-like regulatory domain-containing protein [Ignavibacteriaceae bacterium]